MDESINTDRKTVGHARNRENLSEIRTKKCCYSKLSTVKILLIYVLKVFYEEELDVPLVLFNEVLDHVLRIDRIFKQPQVRMIYFTN